MAVATWYLFVTYGYHWSMYYTTPGFISPLTVKDKTYNTDEVGDFLAVIGSYLFKARGGEMMITDTPDLDDTWTAAGATWEWFYQAYTGDVTSLGVWNGGLVVGTTSGLYWVALEEIEIIIGG